SLQAVVRDLLARVRETDRKLAERVDRWIANSTAVRDRIAKYYEVSSPIDVVHPPTDVESFRAEGERGDFWLFVGRLSAYKRADVAIGPVNDLGLQLMAVSEGRERGA